MKNTKSVFPTEETVFLSALHNPDLTLCFVPLKDGSVAEMTEIQFNQIQAGATIGGVSKDDFRPRRVNIYQQISP
jgi:hypothetical protein